MDWIEHDGTCCPVPVGTWVEARRGNGKIDAGIVKWKPDEWWDGKWFVSPWIWGAVRKHCPHEWGRRVVAYRIPSAHHIAHLLRIAENPVRETENA